MNADDPLKSTFIILKKSFALSNLGRNYLKKVARLIVVHPFTTFGQGSSGFIWVVLNPTESPIT